MLQSRTFTKTRKEPPADEVSKNARLLIQGGFIDKLQAGVYTYLPLGFKVLKNIENIIREEMFKIGGQEIFMPSLHPKENWEKTGRWETMDDLYKVKDNSGRENALGPTHEEVVVPLAKQFVSSYRDLPVAVFQIQNKFRMELRAKSGILRGREFLMKDLYSFHATEEDLKRYYEVMKKAYKAVFKRVGLGERTYLTFASGGSFSKYSHEFQTVTPAGEDTIFLCEKCDVGVNKEIFGEQKTCPECGGNKFKEETSIEVGNIFELKTKFSAPFHLTFKNKEGKDELILMGCYGIGLGRIMGALVEVHADDRGIVWPPSVAPFLVHILSLGNNKSVSSVAQKLHKTLLKENIRVLYDDRDVSPGEKFAASDLMGIPYRIVISEKTIKAKKLEFKERKSGKISMIVEKKLLNILRKLM